MPAIVSSQPFVKDGVSYPLLMVNLIVAPRIENNKVVASTVVNLLHYRVEQDGTLIDAGPESRRSLLFADAYTVAAKDPALAQALGAIQHYITQFIAAKGL